MWGIQKTINMHETFKTKRAPEGIIQKKTL